MLRGASLFHGKRIRNRKKKIARCARCALSPSRMEEREAARGANDGEEGQRARDGIREV